MMKDEEIKKNVVDELYWDDRLDASEIKTEVKDGKVILEGKVPTYRSKIIASKDAWNVSKVKWVDNHLEVKYLVKEPTDEDIVREVHNRLNWNQHLHPEKIEIISSDGKIILKGVVDSFWKKTLAESEAENVMGVKSIENKIVIVPSHKFTDQEIARRITGVLTRRPFISPEDVEIIVMDGVVTLKGEVDSWSAYHAATSAAHYTAGVKDVENELNIK